MEGTLTINRTSPPYASIDLVLLTTNDVIWSAAFPERSRKAARRRFSGVGYFYRSKKREQGLALYPVLTAD